MSRADSYKIFANFIKSLEPESLDKNMLKSLTFMVKHPSFESHRALLENKIIEVGDYLKKVEDKKYEALAKEIQQFTLEKKDNPKDC